MRDVAAYLSEKVETAEDPEMGEIWRELKEYHQKRLWHQLTQTLLRLVQRPEMQKGDNLYSLYTNVIADFEVK